MNDMSLVIVPKSDQINADDFLAGPRTITVTAVSIRPGTEQPVSISYEGDGGKPFKPSKGMCRIMVALWGPDANAYVGRSMTLYRDASVKWGGLEVGGIRISHMSHIEGPHTLALTMTKGNKKPHTVKPLAVQQKADKAADGLPVINPATGKVVLIREDLWLANVGKALGKMESAEALRAWRAAMGEYIASVHDRDEALAMNADRLIGARLNELSLPEPGSTEPEEAE